MPFAPANIVDQWKTRVAEWKKSGMSCAEWCRIEKLKYSVFMYWKSRLARSQDTGNGGQFYEISAEDKEPQLETGVELQFGNARIRLQPGFDEPTLSSVIRLLGDGS